MENTKKLSGLNMTSGNSTKLLLIFAIPTLIGNILNQVYTITDSIIVGRVLGESALAAIGCAAPVIYLLGSMIIGVNVGVSILLSQEYGKGDIQAMRRCFYNSLYVGLFVALVMAIVGNIITTPILRLMQTPSGPFPQATIYLRISFCTTLFPLLYFLFSSAFRGMGDSKTALYCLIISVISNIFLDYLFVAVWNMGVGGSAIATALAQAFSIIISAIILFNKYPLLRPNREDTKFNFNIFKRVINNAIPIALQSAFTQVGNLVAQSAVNKFGETVMAAYTAASRVGALALMPLETIGSSLAVYVGQNYGAKKPQRIKDGMRSSFYIIFVISTILAIALTVGGKGIASIFLEEPSEEITRIAYLYLLITSVPGIIAGIMHIYQQTLRGLNHPKESMYGGFVQLGVRIIIIAIGAYVTSDLTTIWLSWPISFLCSALFSIFIFYRTTKEDFNN